MVAQVFAVHAAIRADAAGVAEPWDPDALAQFQPGDSGSDNIDPADDFVTGDDRHKRVRKFAVDDMQIRAADAAGGDLDADLPGSWLPIGQFGPLQRTFESIENHCMHEFESLLS